MLIRAIGKGDRGMRVAAAKSTHAWCAVVPALEWRKVRSSTKVVQMVCGRTQFLDGGLEVAGHGLWTMNCKPR